VESRTKLANYWATLYIMHDTTVLVEYSTHAEKSHDVYQSLKCSIFKISIFRSTQLQTSIERKSRTADTVKSSFKQCGHFTWQNSETDNINSGDNCPSVVITKRWNSQV